MILPHFIWLNNFAGQLSFQRKLKKDDEQRHFVKYNQAERKKQEFWSHNFYFFEVFKTFVQFAALQTEQIMSDVDNET